MADLYASRDVRYVSDEDGSMVLLHLRTGKYTFLNKTAGRVWLYLVENGGTVEQALAVIASDLGVSDERFMLDMVSVVASWRQVRIVTSKE